MSSVCLATECSAALFSMMTIFCWMKMPDRTSSSTIITMVKSIFLRLFKDVYPLYQPVHVLEQTVITDGFIRTAAQVPLLVVDFAGKDKMAV